MPRALPASLGFLAAALIVVAALLPEYDVRGTGIAQVDPGRVGWVPALVGMLVEVGLVMSAALMVILGESRRTAGGIMLGAGILGLTLRIVRLFQIAESPDFDAAVGSWVDASAGILTVAAGIVALLGLTDDLEDFDDEDGELSQLTPPPGEPA